MVRVLRIALLVIMTFMTLSLIVVLVYWFARPETGPVEKVLLGAAVVALLLAARPVRRLGSPHLKQRS